MGNMDDDTTPRENIHVNSTRLSPLSARKPVLVLFSLLFFALKAQGMLSIQVRYYLMKYSGENKTAGLLVNCLKLRRMHFILRSLNKLDHNCVL